jgi:BirA family transcriptional regulator, biotin operon repressor / biotin---[acetyl-CoA-carboxylase] ligase
MEWKIHHKAETVSTNLDAHDGAHGDVFTADYQTAGRGRLDHKWLSPPGVNLMMSVVLGVEGLSPESLSTLPLVIGLAVVRAIRGLLQGCGERSPRTPPAVGAVPTPRTPSTEFLPMLKWPNDVLVGGRKVSGILCERHGDRVIVGIGVNVRQREFPSEIASRAASLAEVAGREISVAEVRDAVLEQIGALHGEWRAGGFAAVYPQIRGIDWLRGRTLSVRQTDDDAAPVRGTCGGIQSDGSLLVGATSIYAGEAHVEL